MLARFALLSIVCLSGEFPLSGQTPPQVFSIELDGRIVAYTIENGFAITQGDIILGRAADVESYRAATLTGDKAASMRHKPASIASTSVRIWPNATMYYVMDADTPVQQNILDAIAYWNSKPPFQILPRTNQANYVHFHKITTDAACQSNVGMVGGEQFIGVTSGCITGSAIHELGHSWGLLHEQERADRGKYITVLYENIDKRYLSNFNQVSSTEDLAYYDYDSIMHYGPQGFARNFQDTMETVPVGIPIGQRTRLSAGDLDGVMRLYGVIPKQTTITTIPEGLGINVDGQTFTSPQPFDWEIGSQHSVAVEPLQGTSPRYFFARWSDLGAISHVITASGERTVFAAEFVRQYGLQSGVSQGRGTASIFPMPVDGYLPDRYPFLATATPAAGSQFVRWAGLTYLGANGASVSNSSAKIEVTSGAANYQATFSSGPLVTVDSIPQGVLVVVDGASYYTPVKFSWPAASLTENPLSGTSHTLSVNSPQYQGTNTQRFTFVQWEDGSVGPRTVGPAGQAITYTAIFNKQYILTASATGNGKLNVTPPSNDGYYDANSTVQVVAAPNNGQTLRYWLGDLLGNSTAANITMDQDRYVVGNFGTQLPWLMLNSASYALNAIPLTTGQAIAPGELVSIFGTGIGPAAEQFPVPDSGGKLPTSVAGVTVTFDKYLAAFTYAGPNQLNVVVPFEIAGQAQSTISIKNSLPASPFIIPVVDTLPGLFTYDGSGRGPVAALNQDGTINSALNPAVAGDVVVLYGTGAGLWNRSFADGQIMSTDLGYPLAPVSVRFGKLDGEVQYAGTAPYLVNGALQVNVVVPAATISGGGGPVQVPLQVVIGRYTSAPGTSIWVK